MKDTVFSQAEIFLDHSTQKLNAKERAEESLSLAYEGGLFKVTPDLMAFVSSWNVTVELYLRDSFDNPIKIKDPGKFLEQCQRCWYEVMNDWHNEYENMKQLRKPQHLDKGTFND
tara:strand:+ start:467 stop:811 length:345 start_codon:yes stop_codon:yes gene_type:complete